MDAEGEGENAFPPCARIYELMTEDSRALAVNPGACQRESREQEAVSQLFPQTLPPEAVHHQTSGRPVVLWSCLNTVREACGGESASLCLIVVFVPLGVLCRNSQGPFTCAHRLIFSSSIRGHKKSNEGTNCSVLLCCPLLIKGFIFKPSPLEH